MIDDENKHESSEKGGSAYAITGQGGHRWGKKIDGGSL